MVAATANGDEQSRPLESDGGHVFRTEYSDETPTQAIARGITTIKGCGVDDIEPISQYVSADSMNRMMETARDSNQDVTVRVTLNGFEVIIDSDGSILIYVDDTTPFSSD